MRRVSNHRPNVWSAKSYKGSSVGEVVTTNLRTHTLKGKRRALINEMCDICDGYAYFKRSLGFLKERGWRRVCKSCYKEHGLDAKRDRVVVESRVYSNDLKSRPDNDMEVKMPEKKPLVKKECEHKVTFRLGRVDFCGGCKKEL